MTSNQRHNAEVLTHEQASKEQRYSNILSEVQKCMPCQHWLHGGVCGVVLRICPAARHGASCCASGKPMKFTQRFNAQREWQCAAGLTLLVPACPNVTCAGLSKHLNATRRQTWRASLPASHWARGKTHRLPSPGEIRWGPRLPPRIPPAPHRCGFRSWARSSL